MATDGISPPRETMVTEMLEHGISAPTSDVVQDFPAAWDWRIVAVFVVAAAAILYF